MVGDTNFQKLLEEMEEEEMAQRAMRYLKNSL
jgi:hypothetical protein